MTRLLFFATVFGATVAVTGCGTDCDSVATDVAKVASEAAMGCTSDADCRLVTLLPARLSNFCATACGVVAGPNLTDAEIDAALIAATDGADDCRCTSPPRCSAGTTLACASGTCTMRVP